MASRLIWPLIGLTPMLMALATFSHEVPGSDAVLWTRFMAPPVLLAEIATMLLAWRTGAFRTLRSLGLTGVLPYLLGALLILSFALALTVASDQLLALLRTWATFVHVGFGVAVAALIACRPDDLTSLWRWVVAGSVGYAVLCVTFVVTMPDPAAHDWQRFGLGVLNVRHVGFYLVVGIAAAVALACADEDARRRGALLVAAAIMAALLVWSGSRGGLVALLTGAVLTVAAFRPRRFRLLGWTAGILGIGVAASMPFPVPSPQYGLFRMVDTVAEEGDASSGRGVLWSGTIDGIRERPLLGHGEGQFLFSAASQSIFHHPHQVVLQILYQWGAVGLILTASILALVWSGLRRAASSGASRLLPGFSVLYALLVYSLYDGIIFFVYPSMAITLALAATIGGGAGVARAAPDRYLDAR